MHVITYKVPGGKLLRLKTEVRGGKLHKPQLSGDFFLMPPEKLSMLEAALDNWDLANTELLAESLQTLLKQEGIIVHGMSPADIARVVSQVPK